jgi:hypothetical protein
MIKSEKNRFIPKASDIALQGQGDPEQAPMSGVAPDLSLNRPEGSVPKSGLTTDQIRGFVGDETFALFPGICGPPLSRLAEDAPAVCAPFAFVALVRSIRSSKSARSF